MKSLLVLILVAFALQKANAYDFRKRANHYSDEYTEDDVRAEIEVGKGLAARILEKYQWVERPEVQKYLNSLGSFVASKVGRPELTYYFGVIDSADVNAYALPGGYIFVTKAAMKAAGSEDALIGVLAHEMAHVNQRHVVKELGIHGQSFWSGAFSALSGAQTQSIQAALSLTVGQGLKLLFQTGLQKRDELRADHYAGIFLLSLGIKPDAYIQFLDRLKNSETISSSRILRKTHPSFEVRIAALKKLQKGTFAQINTVREDEKRYHTYTDDL